VTRAPAVAASDTLRRAGVPSFIARRTLGCAKHPRRGPMARELVPQDAKRNDTRGLEMSAVCEVTTRRGARRFLERWEPRRSPAGGRACRVALNGRARVRHRELAG
jgi:hypothetical protein